LSTDPHGAHSLSLTVPIPASDRKDQAKDLFKAGAAASLVHAQFQIARLYGFRVGPSSRLGSSPSRRSGNSSTQLTPTTSRVSRPWWRVTRHCMPHSDTTRTGRSRGLPNAASLGSRRLLWDWPWRNGRSNSDMHQWGQTPYVEPRMDIDPDDGAARGPRGRCECAAVLDTSPSSLPRVSRWTRPLKWLLDQGANPNCRDLRYEISGHPYPGTALGPGYPGSMPITQQTIAW